MLSNYLTIALRNLLRHKLHTLINLLGLAIGLASCVISLAIIYHEYSYDRFHIHGDRIYRVMRERIRNNQQQVRELTSVALARTLEDEMPEVEPKFSELIERHMGSETRAILSYRLQPLYRMHLYSIQDYNLQTNLPLGSIRLLYVFVAIALLILSIAIINFINLVVKAKTLCRVSSSAQLIISPNLLTLLSSSLVCKRISASTSSKQRSKPAMPKMRV